MKKNNINQLKEMVNNNVLETVETVAFGVQAYNISAKARIYQTFFFLASCFQ